MPYLQLPLINVAGSIRAVTYSTKYFIDKHEK